MAWALQKNWSRGDNVNLIRLFLSRPADEAQPDGTDTTRDRRVSEPDTPDLAAARERLDLLRAEAAILFQQSPTQPFHDRRRQSS